MLLAQFWFAVCEKLKVEYGDTVFNSWIRPLIIVRIDSCVLYLNVKNAFLKSWIEKHYSERILAYARIIEPRLERLEINIDDTLIQHNNNTFNQYTNNTFNNANSTQTINQFNNTPNVNEFNANHFTPPQGNYTSQHQMNLFQDSNLNQHSNTTQPNNNLNQYKSNTANKIFTQDDQQNFNNDYGLNKIDFQNITPSYQNKSQYNNYSNNFQNKYDNGNQNSTNQYATYTVESTQLDPSLTFDAFVVGKSNELAYAASKRIAESENTVYNPLFLYSGVGLGKTHLMHSIAWSIKTNFPHKKIIYLSAEKFMYQFIKALRYKNTVSFKEQFRAIDVLMVDDIQFICGKDSTQEEFFHTFNELVNNNRQVIISADKSPSDLDGIENRLKSRLGWGLVADIDKTSYELRVSILESKITRKGIKVPLDVICYIADTIDSNVRELEGALNKVIASATFFNKEITLEHAQNLLKDLVKSLDKKITIEEIQQKVASYYTIKVSDLSSQRRIKQLITPRQVAMYLSKNLTKLSLPDIGKKFGGRDHTTIIYAIKKIEQLLHTDPSLLEDINNLKKIL